MLIGKADVTCPDTCGPDIFLMRDYGTRTLVYEDFIGYLTDRKAEVESETRKHSMDAFDENGNLQARLVLWCGTSKQTRKLTHVDVTKEGFYVYDNPKDLDKRNKDAAHFTTDVKEAAAYSMIPALANLRRLEARSQYVKEAAKEEFQAKTNILRQLKQTSDLGRKRALVQERSKVQEALDAKRDAMRETSTYQNMLTPTDMECIHTIPKDWGIAELEAEISGMNTQAGNTLADALEQLSDVPSLTCG